MGRIARVVIPGCPHHVTQRGNRGADVFTDDDDRRAYLKLLKKYCQRHGLAVWAYCLMTNHVHLVVVPEREESLAGPLRDAHTAYAMRYNERMNISGHLWTGRFFSTPMDDQHLWAAVRYVERNPVRAGMVRHAVDHPWSSARAHCGLRHDGLLSPEFPPPSHVDDWMEWLRNDDDAETLDRIRRQTQTGRPCGGPGFYSQLEQSLGRSLRPKKPGRPRKSRD